MLTLIEENKIVKTVKTPFFIDQTPMEEYNADLEHKIEINDIFVGLNFLNLNFLIFRGHFTKPTSK